MAAVDPRGLRGVLVGETEVPELGGPPPDVRFLPEGQVRQTPDPEAHGPALLRRDGVKFLCGVVPLDPAIPQVEVTVSKATEVVEPVLREDHGLAQGFQGLQDAPKLQDGVGVQVGGGLVQHEDRGLHQEGPGAGDLLLLPAGELEDAVAQEGLPPALVLAGLHDAVAQQAEDHAQGHAPEAHAGGAHEKAGEDGHQGHHAELSRPDGEEHEGDAGDEGPEGAQDGQEDGHKADGDGHAAAQHEVKHREKARVDEVLRPQFLIHRDYLRNV